jgi:vanillate O-demethylase monooxygenase subunit
VTGAANAAHEVKGNGGNGTGQAAEVTDGVAMHRDEPTVGLMGRGL